MMVRLGLIAAALVSVIVACAGSADADTRWRFRYYSYDPDYDFYYGPEYLPQPRHYGYLPRDRRDLYDEDEGDYAYDPDYYEPEYVPPRKKRKSRAKPRVEQKARTEKKQPSQKKPKTQAAKKPTTITCAKAGEIVSGYGFKSVQEVSCKGQVYAFNATRDGKPFSVKLSAASGELTEVRKRQ